MNTKSADHEEDGDARPSHSAWIKAEEVDYLGDIDFSGEDLGDEAEWIVQIQTKGQWET
ncbi:MAG TPA: hypothetical protein VN939_13245 [Chthoniobacterales bacterium]|nr:hypothetical protein [Chthoniobacterales bacterium]